MGSRQESHGRPREQPEVCCFDLFCLGLPFSFIFSLYWNFLDIRRLARVAIE